MRIQAISLGIIAAVTLGGLGTAVATTRTAPTAAPAEILMGVGNPHGTVAAAPGPASPSRAELERWENMYSRDVWPGMGVANVHAR